MRRAAAGPYYDADKDRADRDEYYRGVQVTSDDAGALFDQLSRHLADTHTTVLSYKQARLEHLYPVVDLVRDGDSVFLRSLYTGEHYRDTAEFIREAFRATERFEAAVESLRRRESTLGAEAFERELDTLEAQAGFNCEHVVPQAWFKKKLPMVADLHHLFTCDMRCNNRRSNFPLTDFADFPGPADDEPCGKQEGSRFEPRRGKGAAARATLYFLVRYPGKIAQSRYAPADIGLLKRWNAQEPPGEWERHRNAEIFRVQGNRNPFIDFPELASRIDLIRGLG
jgi:endonuclease I